ncbi:hypothetical protein CCACVL1_07124 [Corchorus capsularis]|uniref:Uncharacterized protein n=1 Tax=Corchorus capsularis TaxID=210143 RepID=A0A1R3J9B4_COCAP|nr:hypothetical protein CCACVL1_07124 [Corchorus capsularis]
MSESKIDSKIPESETKDVEALPLRPKKRDFPYDPTLRCEKEAVGSHHKKPRFEEDIETKAVEAPPF